MEKILKWQKESWKSESVLRFPLQRGVTAEELLRGLVPREGGAGVYGKAETFAGGSASTGTKCWVSLQ